MTTPRDEQQITSLVPHGVRSSIDDAGDYEVVVAAITVLQSWLDDDARVERIRTHDSTDRRYKQAKTVRGLMRTAIAIMNDMATIMKIDAQRQVAAIQRSDSDRT